MPASMSIAARPPRRLPGPGELARLWAALSLVGSRGLAMLAQVAVQMAVGALSGPVGLGVLQLFTAWSSVLGELLARGWPAVVLKRTSVAWGNARPEAGRLHIDQASRAIFRGWRAGLAFFALLGTAASLAPIGPGALKLAWSTLALLGAAMLFSWIRIGADALKGSDAPLAAVTLENLALPLTLLALCFACAALDIPLRPALLVIGSVTGLAICAVLVGRAVRARLGPAITPPPSVELSGDRRERRALWFSSLQAVLFLQLPFFVLPAFTDTATIGIYSVAHKLVNVITTLLILLGAVFGPAFARAAAAGDRRRLGQLLARTQWLSVGIFGPAAAVLVLASGQISGWFNVPSAALAGFMLILVVGQLVNAATGLSGILLNLTGAARVEWRISLASLGITLACAAPVGWSRGATGLAVLFSLVIALKNIASWLAARRHITEGVMTS